MVLQLLLQIGDFRSRLAALARKALVHRIDRNIDEPGTGGQPSATNSKSGRGWNFRVRVRVAEWYSDGKAPVWRILNAALTSFRILRRHWFHWVARIVPSM